MFVDFRVFVYKNLSNYTKSCRCKAFSYKTHVTYGFIFFSVFPSIFSVIYYWNNEYNNKFRTVIIIRLPVPLWQFL